MKVNKKRLHILLFETPNTLKFQTLLIYTTEGCSVYDHVTRGTCAEGAQLRQVNMVVRYGNCHRLEFRGFTFFFMGALIAPVFLAVV